MVEKLLTRSSQTHSHCRNRMIYELSDTRAKRWKVREQARGNERQIDWSVRRKSIVRFQLSEWVMKSKPKTFHFDQNGYKAIVLCAYAGFCTHYTPYSAEQANSYLFSNRFCYVKLKISEKPISFPTCFAHVSNVLTTNNFRWKPMPRIKCIRTSRSERDETF